MVRHMWALMLMAVGFAGGVFVDVAASHPRADIQDSHRSSAEGTAVAQFDNPLNGPLSPLPQPQLAQTSPQPRLPIGADQLSTTLHQLDPKALTEQVTKAVKEAVLGAAKTYGILGAGALFAMMVLASIVGGLVTRHPLIGFPAIVILGLAIYVQRMELLGYLRRVAEQ